jgi:hypothetical protein
MAIQPIDLQTLFTQVDKIGKNQNAVQDGLSVQQALHGIHTERKTEEHIQSVNETQNTGDGIEKVKDQRRQNHDQAGGGKKDRETQEDTAEEARRDEFSDPYLGHNIDISL